MRALPWQAARACRLATLGVCLLLAGCAPDPADPEGVPLDTGPGDATAPADEGLDEDIRPDGRPDAGPATGSRPGHPGPRLSLGHHTAVEGPRRLTGRASLGHHRSAGRRFTLDGRLRP